MILINHAYIRKAGIKTLDSEAQGVSMLVTSMCLEGAMCTPTQDLALYISSIWLFLSCIKNFIKNWNCKYSAFIKFCELCNLPNF